jgi:hypothetical protein
LSLAAFAAVAVDARGDIEKLSLATFLQIREANGHGANGVTPWSLSAGFAFGLTVQAPRPEPAPICVRAACRRQPHQTKHRARWIRSKVARAAQ